MSFDYHSGVSLDVENTGSPGEEKTIRADVATGDGSVTISGDTYELLQFHFHAPAEHLINGVEAPMELHMVHRDAPGNLLVVGRLIEPCSVATVICTTSLDGIFSALPASGAHSPSAVTFDLGSLLPADLGSFRYDGSLTTAPYTEGVKWNVLVEPLFMAGANITAFEALFDGPHGNTRELQALNGRVILTDVSGFVGSVPEPETYVLMLAGLAALRVAARHRKAV